MQLYLESFNKSAKTTLLSNIDFIIYDIDYDKDIKLIMSSICDYSVNLKGVISNFIQQDDQFNKHINLLDYDNESFHYKISNIYYGQKWKYKIAKDNDFYHSIIYNIKEMENCIIDWNNKGFAKCIENQLTQRFHIPITEEIIMNIYNEIDKDEHEEKLKEMGIKILKTYSKDSFQLNAYYINKYAAENILSKIGTCKNTGLKKSNFNWDNINTVNDYILEFNKEIKEVIDSKTKVRFDPEKDIPDLNMFKYKRKPYKGQVVLIESAKRTLLKEKNVIFTAQMGTGKTTLGVMSNDLYMQDKNKESYITLVAAPNNSLNKWKREIESIFGKSNVNIKICKSTVDFIRYMKNNKINKKTYIIISKETAKLGYNKKPAINISKTCRKVNIEIPNGFGYNTKKCYKLNNLAICPDCGRPIENISCKSGDIENSFLNINHFKSIKKSNYKCPNCNSVLWTVFYKKTAKTSIVDYCKRKRIKFDSIIWDEFHNERGENSATGNAFGNLLKMSNVRILLSGTMNNGNASSLYTLLIRLIPKKMIKEGYNIDTMKKFIKEYGSTKAIQKIKDDEILKTSKVHFRESDFKEIAGINPVVYTKFLSNLVISATMDDLGIDMVNYNEYPVGIDAENDLESGIRKLNQDIKSINSFNFSMYESTIVRHYINNPFGWNSIEVKFKDNEKKITPKNLNEKEMLNKEKELLKLIKNKIKNNNKCFVFTDFTGGNSKYNKGKVINQRLCDILNKNNIKSKCLTTSIKPIEREKYINDNEDIQVWISNPILVKESLDLIDYPVIIFYNFDYEPLKIQQASRRAWRSIQTKDCETYYFYTKNTVEEKIMKSITLKKMEMNAIEGKFNIDDFNLVKRTASALGKELYECINVENELKKLNENQINKNVIKLHPIVEKYYN